MTSDDATDGERRSGTHEDEREVRDRLEKQADRAVESVDEQVVDLLSWALDTETRARLYVYLRQHPWSTSEEVANGTGLYPSTVRESLAQLHKEGKVERVKRESGGAGNNPYEYNPIPPSDLVGEIVDDVQSELNAVFNLDRLLDRDDRRRGREPTSEPVTITVSEADPTDEEDSRA